MQKSLKNKTEIFIFCILYLFVNGLFVYKYSLRQNSFNVFLLLFLYISFLILFFVTLIKTNFVLKIYKITFWFTAVFFFTTTIFLNIFVDGYGLNIDRWSAMYVAIDAMFNGSFPYAAIDHMNGRTSNLPGLLFLGIPFYLLGKVEYMQTFSFVVFLLTIIKVFPYYKQRVIALFLLIFSVSYLYEIYAKSDLISNVIFVVFFLVVVDKYFYQKKKYPKKQLHQFLLGQHFYYSQGLP